MQNKRFIIYLIENLQVKFIIKEREDANGVGGGGRRGVLRRRKGRRRQVVGHRGFATMQRDFVAHKRVLRHHRGVSRRR